MTGMDLVHAEGPLLQQILDASHALWADGLSPRAYAQYNVGQLRTPWGRRRLRRYALVDDQGDLLTSAKRYDLSVQIDGRLVEAVGIGAVFTPEAQRANGYAALIIERLLEPREGMAPSSRCCSQKSARAITGGSGSRRFRRKSSRCLLSRSLAPRWFSSVQPKNGTFQR